MTFLMDDAGIAADMSHAIRVLMYSFHEDETRRERGLPPKVSERGSRELALSKNIRAPRQSALF